MFGSLPKFVRGCDHVVKFFQSDKRTRKKSDSKKTKSATKKEEQSDKSKLKEFETPHKIAEAIREQSLGGKDNAKNVDVTNVQEQTQNFVSVREDLSKNNNKNTGDELSVVDLDENGNEIKVLKSGKFSRSILVIYIYC